MADDDEKRDEVLKRLLRTPPKPNKRPPAPSEDGLKQPDRKPLKSDSQDDR
jgi:hypothetical protein